MSVYEYLLLGIVVYFLILAWIGRDRPLTDTDRQLAAVDAELDRQERDERKARSDLYGDSGWRA